MGARELRGDEVDVVIHGANDGVGHRLAGMSSLRGIADQLLDPLQVDDGHYAYQKIHVARHIVILGDHTAVQPFIKQQIGIAGQMLPGGEGAGHLVEGHCLVKAVQVAAILAITILPIALKKALQQPEVIGLRAKIADVAPLFARLADRNIHFRSGVAVKTVTFHHRRGISQLMEHGAKGVGGGGGAGSGRTGNGNNGVLGRHGILSSLGIPL